MSCFNPRSPHGERRKKDLRGDPGSVVSTHAPRTGSDAPCACRVRVQIGFQPTLPARGATRAAEFGRGADRGFNPRSPHGERLDTSVERVSDSMFQPTLPARGATTQQRAEQRHILVSTHAPRTGSDCGAESAGGGCAGFNPRSPHGERLRCKPAPSRIGVFQPTLPARGATDAVFQRRPRGAVSTHAPRTGSDNSAAR